MAKLSGTINSNALHGMLEKVMSPPILDSYIDKNYIELFTGDLFKSSMSDLSSWNTQSNKLSFTYINPLYLYEFTNVWDAIEVEIIEEEYIYRTVCGFCFNFDGSKLYKTFDDFTIKQYTTTGPFLYAGAVYDDISQDLSGYTLSMYHGFIKFSTDGLKLYMICNVVDPGGTRQVIKQFNLSTPFSIANISYNGFFNTGDADIVCMSFSSDGLKVCVYSEITLSLQQFTLETAWDITTIITAPVLKFIGLFTFSGFGCEFDNNGTYILFITGNYASSTIKFTQYKLTTPWDITSAVLVGYRDIETGEDLFIDWVIMDNLIITDSIDGFYIRLYSAQYGGAYYITRFIEPGDYELNCTSSTFAKNTDSTTDNLYKNITLYADGTNLDDITFYIGEYNNSEITYTELTTTGSTTRRHSARTSITGTNKYGLNWKAVGADGSEIERLQITYEKE